MRIGITYDLKNDVPPPPGAPDDFQEEFDSAVTVDAVAAALRGLGHDVEKLGDGPVLLRRLLSDPPDFVFNIAEGQGVGRSREARVPAVLEMLDIPYTGSDPLTLAATLDKDCARRLAASYDVAVPQGRVYTPEDSLAALLESDDLSDFPAIVKPAWEGSSKGVRGKCVVDTPGEAVAAIRELHAAYGQPVLFENYIDGDELTVGVVGNDPPRIVGVMRVLPVGGEERFVYSLEVKRDYLRRVRYECPAHLSPSATASVEASALAAYRALGCRDLARIDFRLRNGVPYFLEANPLPGLNPESSDLVILARLAGWTYGELIESVFRAALDRHGHTMHTAASTAPAPQWREAGG